MEGVEDLKTQLESLKAALRKMDRNQPEGQKVVFTPKQRKLEKYSGRPGETYANVYEFLGRIPRPTSIEEQVYFVTSHFERAAREEVTYRYPEEKNTPQKVLKIPKEAFGERATVSQLIAEFYQTKQEPN